ncbi:MAG: hypothetical protein Q9160_008339 [Pyrenula sp. 1 TL-2023]
MSGIPVHTSSPINPNTAAKPTGTTPKTTEPESSPISMRSAAPTSTSGDAATYPPAQPGAAPGPVPTGAVQPTPTQRIPTQATASNYPPPPQPRAVPAATPADDSMSRQPTIPPPPKAGEVAPLLPHQQQGSLSDPSRVARAQPPAYITSTTNAAGVPAQDLSHPPGYQQNSQASFQDRPVDAFQPLQNQSGAGTANSRPREGLLGATSASTGDDEGKGFWESAGDLAKTAGKKLSEGHDEIWRRINNEK